MIYQPRQLSNGLERVPLTILSTPEERTLANALSGMVDGTRTQETLIARNLGGVVERHWDIDVSVESVASTREQMANGKLSAMGIRADGEWIGMSTSLRSLPLRRPTSTAAGWLPARVTRRSETLSEHVPMVGPNITAWMAAPNFVGSVATEIYRDMIDEAGGSAWTLEPMRGDERMEQVLWDAGMQRRARARFDDREVSGVPPVSGLYVIGQRPAGDDYGEIVG